MSNYDQTHITPTDWIKHIDAEEIAAAYDEAATDAYGDYDHGETRGA